MGSLRKLFGKKSDARSAHDDDAIKRLKQQKEEVYIELRELREIITTSFGEKAFDITAFSIAVKKECFYYAKELLNKGANINEVNKQGQTALITSSWNGKLEAVKFLIENGADVNISTPYDAQTAFNSAVSQGHYEIVKFLLDNGVDIETEYERDPTPLMSAASGTNVKIVDLLIRLGAKVNDKNKYGCTALYYAAGGSGGVGSCDIVKALLKHGADPNEGSPPLHAASINGHYDIVKMLLEHGADKDAKDGEGCTALNYASLPLNKNDKNYKNIVQLLSNYLENKTEIASRKKSHSSKMDAPSHIMEYWEASNKKACGNCRHFSFPVVGKPVCTIPDFLIPVGCPKEKIKSGKEVDPGDSCLFWEKRPV